MFRVAASSVRIAAKGVRGAATVSGGSANEFKALRDATKAHAAETSDLWRKISFYVCVPGAIVGALWVKQVEDEHHHHLQHLKEENGGELPERPIYPYMNIRNRPFPWGNQALFFNPEVNIPVSEE
ncbi:hypothetical protein NliqN6_3486 [Naganishia liquefaciens]|uniref:Cytochrome c oxidase subunit 6a n=1 Tax=Naganishia liquefaciens TaxID=104408 RepID=A0A8H3YF09_9TREE|nr:hypothetical protein NliqN6_3486 [Naganishia liquefaciens]